MNLRARVRRLREPRWRRRLVTLGDQGASSLSNMLVFVLVARSFDSVEPVGAFGATMIAYQLALGATRAVVGQTFLSSYSHADPAGRAAVRSHLTLSTLGLAAVGSVILLALSGALGGLVGSGLMALAVVLPVVLVQDTWRFALVVDRPSAPLTMDVLWLAVVIGAFAVVPPDADLAWFVLVWGLGALLGLLVGWAMGRLRLRIVSPIWWLAKHREMGLRYLGEFATALGATRVVAASLGVFLGIEALGAVRTAEVFYGPHNTLHAGLYLAVVPEGAQARDEPTRLRSMLVKVAGALALLATAWTVVGMLLPDAWGKAIFGAAWSAARPLLVPMGVAMMATAVGSGGYLGLRSLGDAERSLRARMYLTPWQIVCPLAGAFLGGVWGFAAGLAVARIATGVIWWNAFDAALGDRTSLGEPAEPQTQTATFLDDEAKEGSSL